MENCIIYGNGWLGNILSQSYGCAISGDDITTADVPQQDVIINTAAKTPIDWCENNKVATFQSNIIGAIRMAAIAQQHKKKYVFFSSACVFESNDDDDVKDEFSPTNPGCFYTRTKVMAEELIKEVNPNALIVRIRLPLHSVPHPRNTINKLLSYPNINDEQETVTVIDDMIEPLKKAIEDDMNGIVHFVNEGTISPSEIATAFSHKHTVWKKKKQDKELEKDGKAHRVKVIATSKRVPLLPDIRERIESLVKSYEEAKSGSRESS